MVFIPSRDQLQHQVLSPRATDGSDSTDDAWGPMQITAPIIVGVALIIIFAAYLMWYKWSDHFKVHFRRVRHAVSVSRPAQVFMPQYRHRVQHASIPFTLDSSMGTPRYTRRYHSYVRSDSTDSQTPLADSFDFPFPPHNNYNSDSSRRQMPEESHQPGRRSWRWWRLFGVGIREVKPQVPSHRWVVEGPDESSTLGHGDGSLNSPSFAPRQRWIGGLPPVHEQSIDDEGDPSRGYHGGVMQIGDDFSTHEAPLTPAYHQGVTVPVPPGSAPTSARTAAPEYSAVEGPQSISNSRTVTTAPTTYIPQSSYYTPGPTHSNSPAPPYSSASQSRNVSMEHVIHHARSDLSMLYPGSVRAVGRTLPHMYQHERQMSTESMLANSSPMVPQSMY
ncbi:hypothetical protein DEU56DRAFT_820302 [Suillus clintonianus]|uniref:uncharacterized protein n=1 Tax=Suillus clintonianus TaxID=1904413 RepID=UPI001B867E43|nr:uncharacterized protein DEU56DRAFT_820302 [Suillus clintonianus]KAG2127488.1 hypothetical protein DEU56DRAFT_820302 [Suillus clintonianus]